MTQRASHDKNFFSSVAWLSDNDKEVDDSLLEDDIDFSEGIRVSYGWEHDPEHPSGVVGCVVGYGVGSLDTDAQNVYPWGITERRVSAYGIMSSTYHVMATLQSEVAQLRDEIRNLRGLQPQIVYVEEIPLSDAKERVVQYFEEHSQADLEELMINLKIPVQILVDVIDELRKEGTLSPAGEEQLSIHREANDTLVGRKILVVYSSMRKPPSVIATRGRHRAQSMVVSGTEEQPAYAVIDIKLHYVKERR